MSRGSLSMYSRAVISSRVVTWPRTALNRPVAGTRLSHWLKRSAQFLPSNSGLLSSRINQKKMSTCGAPHEGEACTRISWRALSPRPSSVFLSCLSDRRPRRFFANAEKSSGNAKRARLRDRARAKALASASVVHPGVRSQVETIAFSTVITRSRSATSRRPDSCGTNA